MGDGLVNHRAGRLVQPVVSLVITGGDATGSRWPLALVGTDGGISSTRSAPVLGIHAGLVRAELVLVVIENEQAVTEVGLLDHPQEVSGNAEPGELRPDRLSHSGDALARAAIEALDVGNRDRPRLELDPATCHEVGQRLVDRLARSAH